MFCKAAGLPERKEAAKTGDTFIENLELGNFI